MTLFAFYTSAIADSAEGRRPGARHAMMTFVSEKSFEAAQAKAAAAAIGAGWMSVTLEKGMAIRSDALPDDPVLLSAMETALEEGSAIVVHGDELPTTG